MKLEGKRTFIVILGFVFLVGFSVWEIYKTMGIIKEISFDQFYSFTKDVLGFVSLNIGVILGYIFTKKKFIDGGSK